METRRVSFEVVREPHMLRHFIVLSLLLCASIGPLHGQNPSWLFPSRSLMPDLGAGPRDPRTSASLLGVLRNPNQLGRGVEAELSIGSTLPVFLLAGAKDDNPLVLGLEAAVFARFGLQVLEREIIATDWMFAVPVIWHHPRGWTRLRFYHGSSHLGDEYSRRFGEPGLNLSRDALEILAYRQPGELAGVWAGVRFGYNVKPEADDRWVLRIGTQLDRKDTAGPLSPFLAWDMELDQEAGFRPRLEGRVGCWLPKISGRRTVQFSLVFLNGPTPLGQFRFRPTTHIGFSLQGSL